MNNATTHQKQSTTDLSTLHRDALWSLCNAGSQTAVREWNRRMTLEREFDRLMQTALDAEKKEAEERP
jgi:hypothetical protein